MSTYVFGDIQGCFDQLQKLLTRVNYNPDLDNLWFTGDLINRGPKNLETIQFIRQQKNAVTVLGNHDLHFLAVATGNHNKNHKDTFDDLLASAELNDIIDWLRQQPLIHHNYHYTLVHAGVPPIWSINTCLQRSREVEQVLQGSDYGQFLGQMYGNQPDQWQESLTGIDRLRMITNYFTRMRFCTASGQLELTHKTKIRPEGFSPWFDLNPIKNGKDRILFGHWAALEGVTGNPQIIALDTGCVWGRSLTALRLEDAKLFSVAAKD